MRLRTLLLLLLVGLLGVAPAAPAALAAAPSEAKLEVNENCVEPDWPCWATPGSSQPASTVMLAAGGSLTFVDHGTAADLAWTGTAPTCEPGVPVAPAAPGTGWEGKCTFATPGTYRFESSTLWPEYTRYEVIAEGAATGTTGEAGMSPGTGPSGPGPAGGRPTGSPLAAAPKISPSQRGGVVRGSLQVADSWAGARLEVDLVAAATSLGRAEHGTQVVGRTVSASVAAGRRSFSVKLDAKARRALQRRHRLALKVMITLTPTAGQARTVTKSVALHA